MCKYVWDVLAGYLNNKSEAPRFPDNVPDLEFPLFVTYLKNGFRWGCIGTFGKASLSQNLHRFALISALQDERYDPISPEEFPELSVYVSLLHSFEPMEDKLDWELGKHGINIHFEIGNEEHGGTYLPNVPVLNGWDKETTLMKLIKKSGYKKDFTLEDVKFKGLQWYQSIKFDLSFEDYQNLSN